MAPKETDSLLHTVYVWNMLYTGVCTALVTAQLTWQPKHKIIKTHKYEQVVLHVT
jgi:hypothetical protein